MHSDSSSTDAVWLTSPRLRMPTMRLLLLITGNLRTFSSSMWRTALARSSSSRQQWISAVITSRAVVCGHRRCLAPIPCIRCRGRSPYRLNDRFHQLGWRLRRGLASFRELSHRGIRANPIDAFVHRVFDLHGGPPLLEFEFTRRNAASAPPSSDRLYKDPG